MKFKISAKRKDTGKWWQFGQISEGKYGPQLSFKKTPELVAFIEASEGWINFSMFDDDGKDRKPAEQAQQEVKAPF